MNIIELAREHHVNSEYTAFGWQETNRYEFDLEELTRFAALVRAQALEEVADMVSACDPRATPKGIAAAIRVL